MHSKLVLAYVLDQCGVDPDETDGYGRSPLYHACKRDSVECCRLLLRAGADPCITDLCNVNPLGAAARHGNVACMKELLAHVGQGPHAQARRHMLLETERLYPFEHGHTPLLVALGEEQWEAAELLLDAGASPILWDGRELAPNRTGDRAR